MKKKIYSIIALMLIAVSSAWAQEPKVYAPSTVTVSPTTNANEWTLTMPGDDVELEAEYYDDATVTGTATAATGVRAGQDKALVTGLTASGGTLVYAVTANSVTTAPADADFAEGNNTAKGITTAGTYRVWYFAAGDATHSPSEPAYKDVAVAAPLFEGEGTEESPYLIKTYDDLKKFSAFVNDGTLCGEGVYIRLDADIDCTGMTDFVPIGNILHYFNGQFDGNGKTISNLVMTGVDSNLVGLFGYNYGEIKNLTLSGCTISGGNNSDNFIGTLVGENDGTISGCTVKNSNVSCKANSIFPMVGGIAGMTLGAITNCVVENTDVNAVTSDDSYVYAMAGGIAGCFDLGTVSGCEVKGATTITADYSNGSTYAYAGAIFGKIGGKTSGNTYESTVTTKTKGIGDSDYTTKSGQTERGIGNGSSDDIGHVELAGTKKVTIYVPDVIGNSWCFAVDGSYYKFVEPNFYVLPGSDFSYSMEPTNGYKPRFTLSDNTIEVTAVEKYTDAGAYDHTEFTFTMPDDDLTASLSFYRMLKVGANGDVQFAYGQTWASFYNTTTNDLYLPDDLAAYIVTAADDKSATLKPINYVPKNVAVFLEYGQTSTTTNTSADGNLLQGTSAATAVSGISGTVYALHNNKLMKVTSGDIPAGRAYLVVNSNSAAPQLSMLKDGGDETTAIQNSEFIIHNEDDAWYDLQGRKLQQKPAKSGIYIKNGKKIVVVNNK